MNINFCSLPFLDSGYENVVDFENLDSQISFFRSKTRFTLDINTKPDAIRGSITINRPIADFTSIDYLWFATPDGKRTWFYFVTSKEYKTLSNLTLNIELDVFQSYMFNYKILQSFVDRMHQHRWANDVVPYLNLEDEGFPLDEYIQEGVEPIFGVGSPSLIIASSSPLGKVKDFTPPSSGGGGGGSGGTGICWEEGKMSPEGFRFIKGFEGFGPTLHDDGYGTLTIGYGVTASEPEIYNQLIKEQPISEERGAKVAYELLQKNYGLPILESVKKLGCNNQNQFDALTSLAYNSGNGSVTGQNALTNAIALNPNDESVIRPIWESFKVTSGGVHSPGLVARRKQECNMYFGQKFEIRPIDIIGGGTVTENNGNGWLPSGCGDSSNGGDFNGYKSFDNAYGKGWLCPVKGGEVTSKYGWRKHPISGESKFHHGTDIGVPLDTDYIASKDGVVSEQGFNESMGNFIYIDHDDGKYRTRVMHLNKILTKKGQVVKRGDLIGKAGTTGDSTGVHAHWEIRRISDNESTDPAPTLQKGDKV